MELLQVLITTLGGSALVVGAAAWLAKALITSRLNVDIENYKARLKAASDVEIEGLKSQLQVAAKEREIAVNWLHQKRANAIESMYAALVELEESVRVVLDIFSPRNPADIRRYTADAVAKGREVHSAFLRTKIFLTPQTSEILERVLHGLKEPVETYNMYLKNYDDHELHSLSDRKDEAWREVGEVVPRALVELENEFRAVLGVVDRG